MPTGYTAKLCEEEQSFEDFVLTCARNFGACVMQRDEALDVKPKIHEDTFYQDKLVESSNHLLDLLEKDEEDCLKQVRSDYEQSIQHYNEQIKERIKTKDRLTKMLLKVKEWNPPTEHHDNLKKFMIEQLKTTIEFDGDSSYYEEAIKRKEASLKTLTAKEAKNLLINDASKQATRNREEAKKEIERNKQRKEWITALYKSLYMEI